MPFSVIGALATIIFCFINFLKALTNKNFSAAITQAIAWFSGIFGIVMVSLTQFASDIKFNKLPLSEANFASQVFLGLVASSIPGVVVELKKAFDSNDSAIQPPLIPSLSTEEQ